MQRFQLNGNYDRPSDELRQKLAVRLQRIKASEDDDAGSDGNGACPCTETGASSDAEVSDTDSEPLEYAMLSIASQLPSNEVSNIMDKVKRIDVRNSRLKQDNQRLRAMSGAMSGAMSELSAEASLASTPRFERIQSPDFKFDTPVKDDADSKRVEDDCRSPITQTFSRNVTPVKDDPLRAHVIDAQEASKDPFVEGLGNHGKLSRARCGCQCVAAWCTLCLAVLCALRARLEHLGAGELQVLLGSMNSDTELSLANAGLDRVVYDGDASHSDFAGLETQLHRAKIAAQQRRQRLQFWAKGVVLCMALAACVCILLAMACWKSILGAILAILAGGLLFVLIIGVTDVVSMMP